MLVGLLGKLLRFGRRRHRGQGAVEYSLIAVTIAFAGAAGLSVLSTAQRNYFTGLDGPLNPPVPSAPGSILHLTSVDPSTCIAPPPGMPSPWPLGTALSCAATTVWDKHSDSSDLKPPEGTLNWYLDSNATPFATCILPALPNGDHNSCAPTTISPPTDPALAVCPGVPGPPCPHAVTVKYAPSSNHMPGGPSSPTTLLVVPAIKFTSASCVDPSSSVVTNVVVPGNPARCTATLIDATTGVAPSMDLDITWTALPSSSSGDSWLSCATFGQQPNFINTLWSTSRSCAAPTTLQCTAPATKGTCSVVYRRIRTPNGGLSQGDQHLKASIFGGAIFIQSGSFDWSGAAVQVTGAGSKHPTISWLTCKSDSVNVKDPGAPVGLQYFLKGAPLAPFFATTADMVVHGTNGSVKCTAYVIDTRHSTALNCLSSASPTCGVATEPLDVGSGADNPDRHDANAPFGSVTWFTQVDSPLGPEVPIAVPTCPLVRLDSIPPSVIPSPQAPYQTPYISSCDSPSLPVSGNGNTVRLYAVFPGDTYHDQSGVQHTKLDFQN